MGKRKKKVCVNAIDKYLKQIKYRAEFKKPEKTKVRQPRVVISRIRSRRFQELIDTSKEEKNGNITFNVKVPIVKIKPAPNSVKVKSSSSDSHLSKKITRERITEKFKNDCTSLPVETAIPVPRDVTQRKNIESTQARNSSDNKNSIKKPSNDLKRSQKKTMLSAKVKEKMLKVKTASQKLNEKTLPCETKTAKKNSETSEQPSKVKKNVKQFLKSFDESVSIMKLKNNTKDVVKRKKSTHVTDVAIKILKNQKRNCSQIEESSQPNPVADEPCLCEPICFDMNEPNALTNENLIPDKYRPYVEELKSLTAESIIKFIKDNRQYYMDFKKMEPVRKLTVHSKKTRKDEFKDSFKCNPFDSAQQVAMYLALRETFNIPVGSFVECRYFFTLLIPEVCCQLFAKIFKIKISFAPRLIKKLYPKPVCPV